MDGEQIEDLVNHSGRTLPTTGEVVEHAIDERWFGRVDAGDQLARRHDRDAEWCQGLGREVPHVDGDGVGS